MAFASIQDMQAIIAQSFFEGNTEIAGIVMYAVVMMAVIVLFGRGQKMVIFAFMLPLTFIFTTLNVLSEGMTILLIIVALIGLAKEARDYVSE